MQIEQLKWKMVERPLIPIQDSWVDATPFIALILLLGVSIFIIFKFRKKQSARHIVQSASLILFAVTFHRCFCVIRGWFFGLSEIGRDNLSVFQNTCILIPIIASLFIFGRIFCGWICPLGFVQELLKNFGSRHRRLPKLAMLSIFTVITMLLIYRFKPVNFFVIQNMASIFGLLLLIICFLSVIKPGNDISLKKLKYFFLAIWVISILLGIFVTDPWCAIYSNETDYSSLIGFISVLFAGLIISMAWCRYICPLGGLFAALARFYKYAVTGRGRTLTVSTEEYKNTCPMGAITKNGTVDKENCICCLRCIEKHGFKLSNPHCN